ncbi:hypothetical protein Ahy_B08g090968 [Arachis hypogaea]|uniref:Aminotransferase-like plant mobile domain-containing protein n=1 Tax=Arachis hypogaea TaxID=3818 RepID=A0A444Y127_ARAHY|nr:hypothetical protein Ahy_B08g090968 [Arachis hypogaea]
MHSFIIRTRLVRIRSSNHPHSNHYTFTPTPQNLRENDPDSLRGRPERTTLLMGDDPAQLYRLDGVAHIAGVINDEVQKYAVNCTWFQETFGECPEDADDDTVRRYVRAYIMMLLGTQLFADKSGNRIHIRWLPYVARLEELGTYSWGSAALAWLYRCMCRVANRHVVKLAGPLQLLQSWIFWRFPQFRPTGYEAFSWPLDHPILRLRRQPVERRVKRLAEHQRILPRRGRRHSNQQQMTERRQVGPLARKLGRRKKPQQPSNWSQLQWLHWRYSGSNRLSWIPHQPALPATLVCGPPETASDKET